MEVEKFRIRNYKSIIDSGDCYLGKKITILAGKNESGKTTILEALYAFNVDRKLEKCNPLNDKNAVTSIEVTFILDVEDAQKILVECGIECESPKSRIKITLSKSSNNNEYRIVSFSGLKLASNKELEDETNKYIAKNLKKIDSKLLSNNKITDDASIPKLKTLLSAFATSLPNKDSTKIANDILQNIEKYEKGLNQIERFFTHFLKNFMPNFILFSSFDDSFPDSIPLSNLKNNTWAKDLERISNFSIDGLLSNNPQEVEIKKEQANLDFSEQFRKYWTQDDIRLKISLYQDSLRFWIEENNIPFSPSQRSKGQQWYLNFYVKVLARVRENISNIILIDEPGLYLHPKAQKDVLKVLVNDKFSSQIVFSTHSPYLIEDRNLDDIRLVEKVNGETKIIGKVWAKVEDGETLTPILTSIGMSINDSIIDAQFSKNVVVEGMEDVFYLRGLSNICGRDDIHFIGGGGASNMGKIGAILEGWGCRLKYLFDNDDGKKQGRKKLGDWCVLDDDIDVIPVIKGGSTVDLISTDDFKKYVLEDEEAEVEMNSDYIKKHKGFQKVLGARKFLNATKVLKNKEGSFSKETMDNGKACLNKLYEKDSSDSNSKN